MPHHLSLSSVKKGTQKMQCLKSQQLPSFCGNSQIPFQFRSHEGHCFNPPLAFWVREVEKSHGLSLPGIESQIEAMCCSASLIKRVRMISQRSTSSMACPHPTWQVPHKTFAQGCSFRQICDPTGPRGHSQLHKSGFSRNARELPPSVISSSQLCENPG